MPDLDIYPVLRIKLFSLPNLDPCEVVSPYKLMLHLLELFKKGEREKSVVFYGVKGFRILNFLGAAALMEIIYFPTVNFVVD